MQRAATLALVATLPLSAAISQPVKIEGGMVSGAVGSDNAITAFKGIPYAAPPTGKLRWRAPKSVIPWNGVRKADQFGNSCIQNVVAERKPWTWEFMTHTGISEDCLFLNVWTGAKSMRERRPVYVFIHGGGNTEGSGAVPVYDGEGLAKKGVVVVTVNYRLGIFGFFTHPELTAESAAHASGNYALLDQIAALRWVHANIAAFGGNPERVTIGGQSAGASDVLCLMASPLAHGLFQGAIVGSGASADGWGLMTGRSLSDQEKVGVKFADAKGAHSIADLRKMSWQALNAPLSGAPARFGLVVDGYVLPAAPVATNQEPVLAGWTKDDLGGATTHPTIAADAFERQSRRKYGELTDEFLKLYPGATDAQAQASQNESAIDSLRVSTYVWSSERAKTANTKTYTYFWDHALPGPEADRYGAFHSSELPYVMNTLYTADRPFTDEDRRIADTMSSWFANFIRAGDPNGAGLPHWPSTQEQPASTMEVGDTNNPIPVAGSKEKLEFFQEWFARPNRISH